MKLFRIRIVRGARIKMRSDGTVVEKETKDVDVSPILSEHQCRVRLLNTPLVDLAGSAQLLGDSVVEQMVVEPDLLGLGYDPAWCPISGIAAHIMGLNSRSVEGLRTITN